MEFNIIKDKLTLSEMITFVNEVVAAAFTQEEDGSMGEYSPMLRGIALKYYFVKYFTDYELSEDMEENYAAFAGANLYDSICESSTIANQYLDIKGAVNKKIDQLNQGRNAYIAASATSRLVDTLSPIVEKLTTLLEKEHERTLAEIKLSKEAERLTKAQAVQSEYMNGVAEHFTPDEYAVLLKKQTSGEINMDDVVSTVTERYLNSESYQKNIGELADTLHKERLENQKLKNEISARKVVAHPNLQ